jgi:hypothetical protein
MKECYVKTALKATLPDEIVGVVQSYAQEGAVMRLYDDECVFYNDSMLIRDFRSMAVRFSVQREYGLHFRAGHRVFRICYGLLFELRIGGFQLVHPTHHVSQSRNIQWHDRIVFGQHPNFESFLFASDTFVRETNVKLTIPYYASYMTPSHTYVLTDIGQLEIFDGNSFQVIETEIHPFLNITSPWFVVLNTVVYLQCNQDVLGYDWTTRKFQKIVSGKWNYRPFVLLNETLLFFAADFVVHVDVTKCTYEIKHVPPNTFDGWEAWVE